MAFFSTTTLGPGSAAFRGRQNELARLLELCHDEVTTYVALYGGRQNGKTSLLRRLEAALGSSTRACRVNFQLIKGADAARAFGYVGAEVAGRLPFGPAPVAIQDGPALKQLLNERLAHPEAGRFVLILDEWGALPKSTREALANALRAIFDTRFDEPPLARLQVIFSGGVELYDLLLTDASSLHAICEPVYLADLTEAEAVALVADGLRDAGADVELSIELGKAVYAEVAGHPYLTQRLGRELEQAVRSGLSPDQSMIDASVAKIRVDDSLLRRIRDDLREQALEDTARRLLNTPPRFSRFDDDFARLELIGLTKQDGEHWAPRNLLLAAVFRERLGVPQSAQSTGPALDRSTDTGTTSPQTLGDRLAAKIRQIEGVQRTAAAYSRAEPAATGQSGATYSEGVISHSADDARHSSLTTLPSSLPPWVSNLVHIPAGPFVMGSSDAHKQADDDEKPQHTLTLADFWIGKTPVTNAQFRPFVEGDGYRNRAYWTEVGWQWREQDEISEPNYWDDAKWNGADYPVVGVSWFEAVAYCRWLSAQTGHPFRLPSEAEWEKAARGPEGFIWPWGNSWVAECCNCEELSLRRTSAVDQFPNGASLYGTFDMAGNIWEWCTTKYGKSYPYLLEDEWEARYLEPHLDRSVRGGSWFVGRKGVRGASRFGQFYPRARRNTIGLRVASHRPLRGSDE